MSDNNGMNYVWVMGDKEKAIAGFLAFILLIGLGGWWGYNYLFPSDQNRLWDAQSAKTSLESERRSLDSDIPSVERMVADKSVAAGDAKALADLGHSIGWATGMLNQARDHLATVESAARHLKRSSDPAMRAEGVGLAEEAARDHAKLDDYAQRLQAVRDKLAKAVPREK